jgi:hypothetical protein
LDKIQEDYLDQSLQEVGYSVGERHNQQQVEDYLELEVLQVVGVYLALVGRIMEQGEVGYSEVRLNHHRQQLLSAVEVVVDSSVNQDHQWQVEEVDSSVEEHQWLILVNINSYILATPSFGNAPGGMFGANAGNNSVGGGLFGSKPSGGGGLFGNNTGGAGAGGGGLFSSGNTT